jgi:transposase
MLDITAEQMVFLDESIFKQQTGWRLMAYGPIGQPARYSDDMRRGDTWSILPAYTTEGYLPCTGIRQGFFNGDAFFSWVVNELLPYLNPFPQPRSVICLDNLNVHLDRRVRQALEDKGCLIKFLPPYSPDCSPIELTFSILKAWMRRHFRQLRHVYEGDFRGFLQYAVEQSGCDKKAKEHFRYAAGGYKFEGDYKAFQQEL